MRTVQLVTLALLAIMATSPARADIIVDSRAFSNGPDISGCQPPVHQEDSSNAVVGFDCVLTAAEAGNGEATGLTGLASGDVELSASGLHANIRVDAFCAPEGNNVCSGDVGVVSSASLNWSGNVIIGGAGDGTQGHVTISYDLSGGSALSSPHLDLNVFGVKLDNPTEFGFGQSGQVTVPVEFGVPYDISVSGMYICASDQFDGDACGFLDAEATLSFTDANGNALSGAFLKPVPEPSSLLLLASVAGIGLLVSRRQWVVLYHSKKWLARASTPIRTIYRMTTHC